MTTQTEQRTKVGTRIATVGRDGSRMATATGAGFKIPIWTGKLYEAKPRPDGTLTWRLVGKFGGDRSGNTPSKLFCQLLKAEHDLDWYEYIQGIRHNSVCE